MPVNLEKNRDSHGRRVVLAYAIASVCAFSANSAIFWFASCWRHICKQRKRNTDIQQQKNYSVIIYKIKKSAVFAMNVERFYVIMDRFQ